MSDPAKAINCPSHGEQVPAYVCQHVLSGFGKGFHIAFDPEYPDDPYPDAWCDECEKRLAASKGDWNTENEEFAGIKLLCSACYLAVRTRNQPEEKRRIYSFRELQNVELKHRETPRTFSIPRSDERNALVPGQLVKLIFEIAEQDEGLPEAERMWVELVERLDAGAYRGAVANTPFFIKELEPGSLLRFGPEHVAAIYFTDDDPRWLDDSTLASCALQILEEDAWPVYAKRMSPGHNHSGWQIFSDKESLQEKMTEITFFELIGRFAILDSILFEPEGTCWLWDEADLEYKLVSGN